jgi:hypothetical protein
MPIPDFLGSHRKRGRNHAFNLHMLEWSKAQERRRRRRRRKDLDEGGVPVEPNKPNNLSGGAAAALEFDDEAQS